MRMELCRFPFAKSDTGMMSRKATCGLCGFEALVSDNGKGIPADQVALKFRQRRWRIGKSERDDRCPQCVTAEAAVKRRRGPLAENIIQLHEEEPMPQLTAVADPPRQPTREDRRRISETMDVHYDTVAGRYRKAATDDALAKHLDVPRAWVTEIRDMMYGPEGNEQDEVATKAIASLEAEVKEMSTQMIEVMDTFMARAAKLESQIEALKAGRVPKAA